jgi:hypothetical protein
MEAAGPSDTLANIYQTTRRHIPEGSILHEDDFLLNLIPLLP